MDLTKCKCDEVNHDVHLDKDKKPYIKCYVCGQTWEYVCDTKPIPPSEPIDFSGLPEESLLKLLAVFGGVKSNG